MRKIHKTSMLICLAIMVVFGSAGIVVKWPIIEQWLKPRQETVGKEQAGADPFASDPPLPAYVKDLHPQYGIKAELHSNEAKITGSMTVQFDNPKTGDIRFFLYDYPNYPIAITSIREGNVSLPFERRDSVIVLQNRDKGQKRKTLTVQFETAVPRAGTRFGVKDDIWTLTNWYPMLGAQSQQGKWFEPPKRVGFGDPFVYHYADYDISFTSPEGYQWVTSWGRGTAKHIDQGRQEVHYQARRILTFSLVGSPLFHVETLHYKPNLTVDIASTEKGNLNRIKAIADATFPTYTEIYGPLPYPNVAIAEVNTYTHAMEYSNLAIFRKNLYRDNAVDHWLPHEIAHMWWYNSVETLESMYGWIDEGIVEMSVYFYKKKRYGASAAESVLQQYSSRLDELKRTYPYGKLGKTLEQFATGPEFDLTWYGKGAMLYDYLRRQIGDEKYIEFVKRVQRNYQGTIIGPEHLDQALGQALRGEAHFFVPNSQQLNSQPFLPPRVQYYVNMVINGMGYYPSVSARIMNGTVYLPLREVMEKLGYQVAWTAQKGVIKLQATNNEVELTERGKKVVLNGKTYQLDQPLMEFRDHAMVPLSFFRQVMNYQVEYDDATKTAKITVTQTERK